MTPQAGNLFADTIDRGPWFFYDRLTTAAGAATLGLYPFFTTGITATKTKSDTNLYDNLLSAPQAFAVQSLGFIFGSAMLIQDVNQFLKNYYCEFQVASKVYAEGPLHLWPGGAGLSGFVSTNHATTSVIAAVNNGEPTLSATRRFPDYPRIIPYGIRFFVNVKVGASVITLEAAVAKTIVSPAYGGLDAMTVLDGILDREVM